MLPLLDQSGLGDLPGWLRNTDSHVVSGRGGGRGPQIPMVPYQAASNISLLIEAGEDHSTHVLTDARFAAEQR